MRQVFLIGDGPALLAQAQSLIGLGWAVTAVVVDRPDPDSPNKLEHGSASAVVDASTGAATIAQLVDRLVDPAALRASPARGADDHSHTALVEGLPDGGTLTMGENLLLQALLQGIGKVVPYERLFAALGYARADATRKRRALATQIVRLRRKISARHYRIRSRNNNGYALIPIRASAASASEPIPLSDARKRRQSAGARQAV